MNTQLRKIYFLAIFVLILNGCVDHEFDEPPIFEPEAIETNGNINDLLNYWTPGTYTEITEDLIIDGRIAANDENGNFYKQLVIQDESGGIQIRLDAIGLYNEYPLGRRINVFCKGLYISDYNGLPQLSAISGTGSEISSLAIPEPLIPEYISNTIDTEEIIPEVHKINQLRTEHLNKLVKLENVQFTVGSAAKPLADAENLFSFNHDLEDCSENTIILRTSGYASFASEFTPIENGSITGVLSVFRGDYQLLIRETNDIDMQNERCGENNNNGGNGDPVDVVDEDFESLNDNQDVELEGWSNIAVKGTRLWRAKEFSGNVYVQATAYNDTNNEMEAWLISPKITFNEKKLMNLRTAVAFYVHDGLNVFYSTDFDGNSVSSANWTEISINKAGSAQDNYDWVDSGEIDLSEISEDAYIGFRYIGNPSSGTTSVILDDIYIGE